MTDRPRRKSDAARRANQVIRGRTMLIMLLLGVASFTVLFWKLYDLQINRHDELKAEAVSQQTDSMVISASRGTIYDKNGEIMAISYSTETVLLDPGGVQDFVESQEQKIQDAAEEAAEKGAPYTAPEVLDQALLRPGRFDRRIIVDRPNLAGRLATLQVHTRNIRLAEDVNLRKIAIATAGTVGADLANLVNEAALRAVRLGRKAVNQEDLLAAFELVIAGAEKKGSVLSEFEKKLVAYHEVGHAMVAYRQKHAEPVSKITIVPHTQGALGYTLHLPEEDKHLHTRDELLAQITVSMGGRVAEELVLHTMTNGAAQDIQDATGIARNMVAMFGMSDEFGMMALASRRSQYLDGGYGIDCAQDTAAAMDRAVRDLIDACYKKAVEILSHSREDMDKVVEYLLEKETITGAEMVAILEGRDPALADNFPDPDGKGTAGPPAEPVSAPIPLSGGEPQPPDGGGMEFGPEGKPKE